MHMFPVLEEAQALANLKLGKYDQKAYSERRIV